MATCKDTNSSEGADAENGIELFCSPCQADGERLAVVGYCKNCMEYLCAKCYKHHKRPTLMRKHVLLDKEQMVKDISTTDRNKCPNHGEESIKYHCKTHAFFGCDVCFYQHQKTCKDVIHIPELSETFASSEEMKHYILKLENIAKRSTELLGEARNNITTTGNRHSEAISVLKDFKVKILDAIDKLERELTEKADSFKKQQITKMNEIISRCTAVEETQQAASTEMTVLRNKNQHTDVYTAVTRGTETLLTLENELNSIESDKDVRYLKFVSNTDLAETLKGPWGLGKLLTKDVIDKIEFVADINVKTSKDTSNCDIFSSVLMPNNQLVITDWNNENVKLVEAKQQKMISDMTLSNSPRGVAKVTTNTVAVAVLGDKKIVFIRVDPSLSVDRELAVNGECYGVAYHDGKLIVTFRGPYKVDIMDLQGTVLRSIETDSSGRQLFNDPRYVTVNTEDDVMYISNFSGHDIVCLRFDGSVVATYKDGELEYPCQAVVDSTGMVYVCGQGSKNVHQLTPDCRKVKVRLTAADGLSSPRCISYDETEGKLYIGEDGRSNVKVYRENFSTL